MAKAERVDHVATTVQLSKSQTDVEPHEVQAWGSAGPQAGGMHARTAGTRAGEGRPAGRRQASLQCLLGDHRPAVTIVVCSLPLAGPPIRHPRGQSRDVCPAFGAGRGVAVGVSDIEAVEATHDISESAHRCGVLRHKRTPGAHSEKGNC
jgi:hypothetical protein